jgi:hypothetical protein
VDTKGTQSVILSRSAAYGDIFGTNPIQDAEREKFHIEELISGKLKERERRGHEEETQSSKVSH